MTYITSNIKQFKYWVDLIKSLLTLMLNRLQQRDTLSELPSSQLVYTLSSGSSLFSKNNNGPKNKLNPIFSDVKAVSTHDKSIKIANDR